MRVRTSNMFLSRDWRMHRREIHLSGAGVGVLKLCHCRRWVRRGSLRGASGNVSFAFTHPYLPTSIPSRPRTPLCVSIALDMDSVSLGAGTLRLGISCDTRH